METLDKSIDDLTEADWEVIRRKLWFKLQCFDSLADREDATHDALLRLADMLDQEKPLRLLVHVAARRQIDACSPRRDVTLPNGKRRTIRLAPTYRPMGEPTSADALAADDAEGFNLPRDWKQLTYAECAEAGLVTMPRE